MTKARRQQQRRNRGMRNRGSVPSIVDHLRPTGPVRGSQPEQIFTTTRSTGGFVGITSTGFADAAAGSSALACFSFTPDRVIMNVGNSTNPQVFTIPSFSEFNTLFQEYKLNYVDITFVPQTQPSSVPSTTYSPIVITAESPASANAAASKNAVLQIQDAQMHMPNVNLPAVKLRVRPKMAAYYGSNAVTTGGTTNGVQFAANAQSTCESDWVNIYASSGGVTQLPTYLGLQMALDAIGTGYVGIMYFYFTYNFSLRRML